MALNSLTEYINAKKITVYLYRYTSLGGASSQRTVMYAAAPIATDPLPQGSLAISSTTSGVMVTSSTIGFPSLPTADSYYITKVQYLLDYFGVVILQDLIYKAGTYAYNVSQTLSSQPSIDSRVPMGGTNWTAIKMFIECVTAFTGTAVFTITYTNQDGVTGRSTTFTPSVVPFVANQIRVPLQSGDCGVQKIESVTCTGATAGSFNVVLARDLTINRNSIATAPPAIIDGLDRTGAIEIFGTSALHIVSVPDGGSTWHPGASIEITYK